MVSHWVWEKHSSRQCQPPVTSKCIHVFELQLDWGVQQSIMNALISRYRCLFLPDNLWMWFYNFVPHAMCQKHMNHQNQFATAKWLDTAPLCSSIHGSGGWLDWKPVVTDCKWITFQLPAFQPLSPLSLTLQSKNERPTAPKHQIFISQTNPNTKEWQGSNPTQS